MINLIKKPKESTLEFGVRIHKEVEDNMEEYIKKNLRLRTSTSGQQYGCSDSINISLVLNGKEIDSDTIDGSDIENIFPDRG